MMNKIKVAIIGATGYTGAELIRLLITHPFVEIEVVTSETSKGKIYSDLFPQFNKIFDKQLESIENLGNYTFDIAFLALPHSNSQLFVKENLDKNFKIIDLSGAFRLGTKNVYELWYKEEHIFESGLAKSVFGSPELFSSNIKSAKLVANPGCFVTSAILGLAPLVQNNLIDTGRIIIDAKTGTSGAGVNATKNTHFCEVNDNIKPYGLHNHRHTIEINQTLSKLSNSNVEVLFTPHLMAVDRGILSTMYCVPIEQITENSMYDLYESYYADAKFVRVIKSIPTIKNVRGTNFCDIMISFNERTNTILIISAIDNLVKGASGQAIQNMNLMFNFPEITGLINAPLVP